MSKTNTNPYGNPDWADDIRYKALHVVSMLSSPHYGLTTWLMALDGSLKELYEALDKIYGAGGEDERE